MSTAALPNSESLLKFSETETRSAPCFPSPPPFHQFPTDVGHNRASCGGVCHACPLCLPARCRHRQPNLDLMTSAWQTFRRYLPLSVSGTTGLDPRTVSCIGRAVRSVEMPRGGEEGNTAGRTSFTSSSRYFSSSAIPLITIHQRSSTPAPPPLSLIHISEPTRPP